MSVTYPITEPIKNPATLLLEKIYASLKEAKRGRSANKRLFNNGIKVLVSTDLHQDRVSTARYTEAIIINLGKRGSFGVLLGVISSTSCGESCPYQKQLVIIPMKKDTDRKDIESRLRNAARNGILHCSMTENRFFVADKSGLRETFPGYIRLMRETMREIEHPPQNKQITARQIGERVEGILPLLLSGSEAR